MKKNTRQNRNENPKRGSELESLLHSEQTVTIEKMAVGGAGVARVPFKDKSVVVFVDRAAPHDVLKIKITHVEKNFLKGQILEIITAGPTRRSAPCEYFEKCGGCSWQHIYENEQINQKENLLKELFQKFVPDLKYTLQPTIFSENNFHYRNRIQLKQIDNKLGYFQKESHDIIDINSCLIADQKISSEISNLKNKLRPTKNLKKFELKLNQKNEFEYYPIGETGEGLSFSQVNNSINQKLISLVTKITAEQNPTFLTELYSGSGNFTFELLKTLPDLKIESAELNSDLTRYANQQLTTNNYQKRLFCFTTDCESFVQRRAISNQFVLLDPPRAGCTESIINKLAIENVKNIVYISCHPVSLVRDLKNLLTLNKNYQVKHLQIFDMFPQTDHFETIIQLSLI